jgi:uncharacterized protein with NAD-binding domain and iron-sulfur cluster
MPHVAIFGAGISGLTVAHELAERGFKVDVYESSDTVGGMAKSRRLANGVPTEHSWRGYAPFYRNLYAMMKRIPYRGGTVEDQLSRPVVFHVAKNQSTSWRDSLIQNIPSPMDTLVVTYHFARNSVADHRKQDYRKRKFVDTVTPYLTEAGRNYYHDFLISPGWGMDSKRVTEELYFHFPHLIFFQGHHHWSLKRDPGGDYIRYPFQYWSTMRRPTSEAFCEPWRVYLEGLGVHFHFQHSLTLIRGGTNSIQNCEITLEKQRHIIQADDYVFAVNPYHFRGILEKSGLLFIGDGEFSKFAPLTRHDPYDQVSFRLGFNRKILFPRREIGMFLADSPFCILLYPQDSVWEEDVSLGNIGLRSLWSGTCCGFKVDSPLYGKRCDELTREEYMKEILSQVFQATDLLEMLERVNGFRISREDIVFHEIWGEWYHDGKRLRTTEPEWTTLSDMDEYRPEQKTEYVNAWLGGAHTKTEINVWTMEGAAESGRAVSQGILEKYSLTPSARFRHMDSMPMQYVKKLDNELYKHSLPNLVDLVIVILVILILIRIFRSI